MATERQRSGNLEDGRDGEANAEEGRAVGRLDTRKHGVFASALTDYDKGVENLFDKMVEHLRPEGPIEEMLTEMVALSYLRIHRCVRAEGEYHHDTWHVENPTMMGVNWFKPEKFQETVDLFSRYSTSLTNQLVKLLHELERVQRMRLGKDAPPPLVADVNVTYDGDVPDDPRLAPAEGHAEGAGGTLDDPGVAQQTEGAGDLMEDSRPAPAGGQGEDSEDATEDPRPAPTGGEEEDAADTPTDPDDMWPPRMDG